MNELTPNTQNNEIDLRELFSTLNKRKKLISLITIIITILAIVYAFFVAKPVYSVNAMIEIGEIDNKPIDNINSIQQKLSYIYKVNKKRSLPLIKSISASKKSKRILSIIIHGNNNKEALKYIQTIINKIETQYKEKTDAYINNQKELIKLVQKDIKDNSSSLELMKSELAEYNQKIISLKSEDAALAGIYALQIGQNKTQLQDFKKYISGLKTKEQDLKLSITPLMMKPTRIVGEIETLEKAIKPKKALIIIVAFITGLMLSVFLAFFLEFIQGFRKSEIEKDN